MNLRLNLFSRRLWHTYVYMFSHKLILILKLIIANCNNAQQQCSIHTCSWYYLKSITYFGLLDLNYSVCCWTMLQSQSRVFSNCPIKPHLFFLTVCTLPICNHLVPRPTWLTYRCSVSAVPTSLLIQHSCLAEAGTKVSLYPCLNSAWHRWVPTSDRKTVPGSHTRTEMSYRVQLALSV